MYRYMEEYPRLRTYIKVAKFEMKNKNNKAAREIFERTLEELGKEAISEEYFMEFAKFEARNKEIERAREIYKFGLQNIPKEKARKMYEDYLSFEKQHGDKEEIDDLVAN